MREKERSYVVITRLQTHGRHGTHAYLGQETPDKVRPLRRVRRAEIAHNGETAATIRGLTDRFCNAFLFQVTQQIGGESSLDGR